MSELESREAKMVFVEQLIDNIKREMLGQVSAGKVPEDWDGHELRQWLADRCALCVLGGGMGRARKRRYRNACLVQNLL